MKRLAIVLALAACSGERAASTGPGSGSSAGSATAAAAPDPWLNANDPPAVEHPPDVQRLVDLAQNGPSAMVYPEADSVVALEQDDITLAPDGTITETHHSIVKILDAQRGKARFADLHVPFDGKRQTLEILTARTVTVAAELHAASRDEIADIVPAYLADATNYSDVRERVISFPGVDTGSVVELVWKRTTRSTPDSAHGGELLLGGWQPTLSRVVSITMPKAIAGTIAVANSSTIKPVETSTATTHTFTITVDKTPDAHPELGQPADPIVLPRVVYGFKSTWADVLAPIADRFLRLAVPEPLPASIVAKAEELTASATTTDEKARAIYAFVSREIREIAIPLGVAGYEPNSADVVLAHRYGDDRDKTALLIALLAAEQIPARPVLVRSSAVPVLPSVPTLAQFDRMIASISVDGKTTWVSPADEHGTYGIVYAGQDNLVLPVARDGAELGKRELLAPSSSTSKITAKLALSDNGDLDARFHYELSGYFANTGSRWLRPLTGENLDRAFQAEAANVAGGAVDLGHTITPGGADQPLVIDHHVKAPGYAQVQGTVRVLELPSPSLGIAANLPASGVSERKAPLDVGTPRTHVVDVSVAVPAGWKVAFVPPPIKGSAPGLNYDDACTATGQTVTCHSELALDRLIIDAKQYAEFHAAMTKLGAYERRVILLTR